MAVTEKHVTNESTWTLGGQPWMAVWPTIESELRRVVWRRLPSECDVDDVLQEVCARMLGSGKEWPMLVKPSGTPRRSPATTYAICTVAEIARSPPIALNTPAKTWSAPCWHGCAFRHSRSGLQPWVRTTGKLSQTLRAMQV